VSGLVPAIERLREALKALSGVKVKDMCGEVGLHSLLMDPVVGRLNMYLEKVDFNALSIPLISGSTAELITAQEAIRPNVIAHINNPVRWTDVIKRLESCDVIIEVGPGNSLQQPIQAWYPHKQVVTVNKPEDIEKVKSLVCIKQDKPVEPLMSTFDRQDTFTKIVDIVASKLDIDKNIITNESTFQDLGADSLDLLEIIMRLEEQFGIEVNDEDAEKMHTMHDVVSYIHERRTK
jgi:acyl carrier protein